MREPNRLRGGGLRLPRGRSPIGPRTDGDLLLSQDLRVFGRSRPYLPQSDLARRVLTVHQCQSFGQIRFKTLETTDLPINRYELALDQDHLPLISRRAGFISIGKLPELGNSESSELALLD